MANLFKRLLMEYRAPQWMKTLKNIPAYRVKAATENTPIQRWHLPGVPKQFEVYIKREDLTGCLLSGNKVRGLEFLFGDAIQQGCTTVCSTGHAQSNFIRTMALMASTLGMQSHFVIYPTDKDAKVTRHDVKACGNNILLCLAGAHQYHLGEFYEIDMVLEKAKLLAETIRNETGEEVYSYANDPDSFTFGYLHVFDEMIRQDVGSFSDIVVPSCCGDTTFGLAVGNHLNGRSAKIHSLVTGESKAYVEDQLNDMLQYFGMQGSNGSGVSALDICHISEHLGDGYGKSTSQEKDFLKRVALQTGIILGPTYSGKAAYNLVKLLNEEPERFKGNKILFMHTGGTFELFDGRMEEAFDDVDYIKQWDDVMENDKQATQRIRRIFFLPEGRLFYNLRQT